MRNEPATVSTPGPRLPVVLKEITECLRRDDWCRVSSDDGSRKYYIVGYEAHDAHQAGEAEFNLSEFPIPTKESSFASLSLLVVIDKINVSRLAIDEAKN